MKKPKHLNLRGKVAIVVFVLTMTFLVIGLTGKMNETNHENKHTETVAARDLSFSFEPIRAFAKSKLNQSIVEQKRQEKEIARQKEVAKREKKDQQEKVVYLTFDDGPSQVTNQLLDKLQAYQLNATFFMLGPNMKTYPSSVKRMVKEGFGVGLHGISHSAGKIYAGDKKPVQEMSEDQAILKDLTGAESNLIRLPYGSIPYLTEDMRTLLDAKDFQVWDWNVDSGDWEMKGSHFIQNTIQQIAHMEQTNQTPVILLHDRPSTVKYIDQLFHYLKKNGFKAKELTNDMAPLTFQCEGRCHPI